MKKNRVSLGFLLLLFFFVSACDRSARENGEAGSADSRMIGQKMPAFVLPAALDGAMVDSEVFRGRAALVVFFATWCPPCLMEVPHLIELQEKYGEAGFSVIAVSTDQTGPQPVRNLIARTGINYPVLMGDEAITRGFGGIVSIPDAYLVNPAGNVVQRYLGYTDVALLDAAVRAVLPGSGQDGVGDGRLVRKERAGGS